MGRQSCLHADWYDLDNGHLYYGIAPDSGGKIEVIRIVCSAIFEADDENPITVLVSNGGAAGSGNEWTIVLSPKCPSKTVECCPRAVVTASTGQTAPSNLYGVAMATDESLYFRIGANGTRPLKYDGSRVRVDWFVAYIHPSAAHLHTQRAAPYTTVLKQVKFTLDNSNPIPYYVPPAGHSSELVRVDLTAYFAPGDTAEPPIAFDVCGGANQTNGAGCWLTPSNPRMSFDYSAPPQWATGDDTSHGNVYGIPDDIDERINFQLFGQMASPPAGPLKNAGSKLEVTATIVDVTPWTPLQLGAKLIEWWSARLSAKTLNGSNQCTQWNGMSANAYHLLQATASKGGVYYMDPATNRYQMQFNHANHTKMSAVFAVATPVEVIASIDASGSAGSQYFWNLHTTASADRCSLYRNANNGIMYGSGTGPIRTDTWTGWGVWDCLYNGASSEFRLNNGTANTGDIGTAVLNGFVFGGFGAAYENLEATCNVGDIVLCNAALTTSERALLTAYMQGLSRL